MRLRSMILRCWVLRVRGILRYLLRGEVRAVFLGKDTSRQRALRYPLPHELSDDTAYAQSPPLFVAVLSAVEVTRLRQGYGVAATSFWKRGSFRSGSNSGSSRSNAGVSGTLEASEPSYCEIAVALACNGQSMS